MNRISRLRQVTVQAGADGVSEFDVSGMFDLDTAGNGDEGRAPMGLMFRKRKKYGPIILNFTENGFSSWSIKIGRWSWNSKARAHRVDLPGPLSWKQDKSRS